MGGFPEQRSELETRPRNPAQSLGVLGLQTAGFKSPDRALSLSTRPS